MVDLSKIPGGASTQVAQNAGNPDYVGLSPGQPDQARNAYERSVARGPDMLRSQQNMNEQNAGLEPIPTGLEGQEPPQAAPEATQEPNLLAPDVTPEEPRKVVRVKLPGGKEADVRVPQSFDQADIKNFLLDQGVTGFRPDGDVLDRMIYGARQGTNITENTGTWLKSHFPALSNEIYMGTDGIEIRTPDERYGEDYYQLTPVQKRQRMKEVEAKELASDYPQIHPKNLGKAGMVGEIGQAIADPVALLPAGAAVKAAKTAKAAKAAHLARREKAVRGINTQTIKGAAATGAVTGGAWGGAWGLSEVASEEGLPTSLAEATAAAPKVVEPAVVGAIGGSVLLGAGRTYTSLKSKKAHKMSINPDKAANYARRVYWPKFWDLQEQGWSAGDAAYILRKKMNMSIDDEWRFRQSLVDADEGLRVARYADDAITTKESISQRQGTAIYSPAMNNKDAANRLAEAQAGSFGDPILHGKLQKHVDDVLRPLAGVVRDISPRVYKRLVDMEGAVLRKSHEYHAQFHGFMKESKKLSKMASKEDNAKFAKALYNNEDAVAKRIWMQHGLSQESYASMRQGLNRLGIEMKESGVEFDFLQDYFPRIVKDYEGFRKHIGKNPKLKGLEKRLVAAEIKKGKSLTDQEQTDIINNFMNPVRKKKSKKTVGSEKLRRVQQVTDDLLPFYHDPLTTLEFHLREAVSKAERAKFFGKHMKSKDGVDDLSESVGGMVRSEGLSNDEATRLADALSARFGKGEQSGGKGYGALRQMTGGMTLGNPISAIRQLGDIPSVMKTQGIANTVVSMIKKADPEINPDAFGYMLEMAQELDNKGGFSFVREASQFMYKAGGFRTVDRYSKNVLMKAALRNALKSQKNPQQKQNFIRKYGSVYTPDELSTIMDDLANNRMTDLVKSHINAEIMKIQPISRSQMPIHYLNHPNLRMAWQFRTWGLNQIELFRQEVWRGLKSPIKAERRQAARAGVFWLAGVGITNASITQAQRVLTKRDPVSQEDLPEEMIWQALGNFGLFDRYGIEQAVAKGDSEEYLKSAIPPSLTIPANLGMKVMKFLAGEEPADMDSFRDVLKQTGFGRIINYTMMGGAEEYNEKLRKKKATEANKLLKGSAYAQ